MEYYGIEVKGEEFIIKGDFPEAVRCGEIPETNHLVYQLKSLQLCNMDLQSIIDSLNMIKDVQNERIKEALFEYALVKFFKNFKSSSSRIKLNSDKILKDSLKEDEYIKAKKCFEYYDALRDKHVVHDESRYSESKVLAIINNQSSKILVPKVLVLGIDSVLTDDEHVQPLESLACISLQWVEKKIDELCNKLQEEYNNKTYDELMALDNAQYTAPITAELFEGK